MFIKDAEAILDYGFDWAEWLTEGDAITSSAWLDPIPTTDPALEYVEDSESSSSTATSIRVAGGAAGVVYTLTNRIATANGLTDERSIQIAVEDR
jgi:hypothetical protein